MCDETCTHEYKPLKGSSSGRTASVWGLGGAHYHQPTPNTWTVLALTQNEMI